MGGGGMSLLLALDADPSLRGSVVKGGLGEREREAARAEVLELEDAIEVRRDSFFA